MSDKYHRHSWEILQRVERAPIDALDRISHTGFIVIGCEDCRRASVFPVENFAQTLEPWRAALVELLRAQGFEFAVDESVGPQMIERL